MTFATGSELPDSASRRTAAREFDRNLVVVAGAGTGKTSLLVERVLTAVGAGRLAVNQLAAVTFTRKAAGELRERLALGLERLRSLAVTGASPGRGDEAGRAFLYLTSEAGVRPMEIAGRSLDAIDRIEEAAVGTIHSFCFDLLRSHPLEAGVDPGFAVDDGRRADALFRDEWERFLARELGPSAGRAPLWRDLIGRGQLAGLRDLARDLCLAGWSPDPPSPTAGGAAAPDARALLGPEVARTLARLGELQAAASGLTPGSRNLFESWTAALEAFRDHGMGGLRRRLAEDPLLAESLASTVPAPNARLTGVSPMQFRLVAGDTQRFLTGLAQVDEELCASLLEAVAPFLAAFRETFLATGHVGQDGLLLLARNLLRDYPGVRETVRRRYRMILVDEFQDTDPLQYDIVLLLAESEGGCVVDPFEADLAPGRLFIVGDPKQSIYRFRGADYSAFRRVVDRVVATGGRRLELAGNFRSVPGVLAAINALFSGADSAWTESEHQPAYLPIQPVRDRSHSAPAVELWTLHSGAPLSAPDRRRAEADILALEIDRLVRRERVCRFRDISVLMRAFSQVSVYLRPLRQAGIPFIADGGRDFMERPEVGHLLAALRALARPSDAVALLAFLRSPAGAVADPELAEYAASGGRWEWTAEVDAARFPSLARAFGLLVALHRDGHDLPADALIRLTLARTHLLSLGAAAFEGAQAVANLRKIAAAAADLARAGDLSLPDILEALADAGGADAEGDSPLADEQTDAVRILTVHKAKGLENDVVIIPDMARQGMFSGRRPTARVVRVPGGGPAPAIRTGDVSNAAALLAQVEDRRHERAEEVRVLYVALTRARERLILLAGPPPSRGGRSAWLEALSAWGYDPAAPPADGERLTGGHVFHRTVTAPSRSPAAPAHHAAEPRSVAVDAWRAASATLSESASARLTRAAEPQAAMVPGTGRDPELARAVGITVHRQLERWEGTDDAALKADLIAGAEAASLLTGADPATVCRESERVLDAFLASPLAARFRQVERMARELPVLLQGQSGTAWSGRLDLLYRDRDGRLVIADYKTDRGGADPTEIQHHRQQLSIYAEAVRRAMRLPSPPRTEIWLLRPGEVRLIPVD